MILVLSAAVIVLLIIFAVKLIGDLTAEETPVLSASPASSPAPEPSAPTPDHHGNGGEQTPDASGGTTDGPVTGGATPAPPTARFDEAVLSGLSTKAAGWSYGRRASGTGYASGALATAVLSEKPNAKLIQLNNGSTFLYEIPNRERNLLEQYGGICRKNEEEKVVYLTFDLGSSQSHINAAKIMDVLKEKNLKAIFFTTGPFARAYPELIKRMHQEGHLIGNHTDNHPSMPTKSIDEFVTELETVEQLVKGILGNDYRMTYYRPPEGSYSERDLYLARQMGYHLTLWSFANDDWNENNQGRTEYAYNRITYSLHPGEVFLLHTVPDNAAVLSDVIDYILSQGYTIRRIDQ